ncbi:hypothetical protein [Pedobacter jejuensis]|uniref:hypothetical protein n=1 Tax=Pedobacter jejuensis TaxID=1268550 RepID=UPI0011CDE36F|nr:hypothetical protein [Pedobacter jejuensis]
MTKEGIEFKNKKSYNWEDVISYKSQIYTTSGGGDGSEIDLETLFIYFSDRTGKSFRITEFPLDKTAKEIFNLFDQYKMTIGESERTSWILKFNESPRYR